MWSWDGCSRRDSEKRVGSTTPHAIAGASTGAVLDVSRNGDKWSYVVKYDAVISRAEHRLPRRWYGAMTTLDGLWYDALCRRFGDVRVANAIRSRALTILARRSRVSEPQQVQEVEQ